MKYLILLVNIALSVSGQFFLKFGIKQLVEFKGKDLIFHAIRNPFVLLGMFCYGIGMLTWLAVLSKFDLSVAYPALSLGYIAILIISTLFLGESISFLKVAGILLITGGVILLFK